jgi:phosphoribosyl-ATP pyrophosphohydrolase
VGSKLTRVVPEADSANLSKRWKALENYSDTVRDGMNPIHQLEVDLKEVPGNPARFPRTSKLIAAGAPQQAKKVVEEAAELAIEAIRSDRGAAVMEAADLMYNLVVLLEGMDIPFDDVCGELNRRRGLYGIAAKQQKNGF